MLFDVLRKITKHGSCLLATCNLQLNDQLETATKDSATWMRANSLDPICLIPRTGVVTWTCRYAGSIHGEMHGKGLSGAGCGGGGSR